MGRFVLPESAPGCGVEGARVSVMRPQGDRTWHQVSWLGTQEGECQEDLAHTTGRRGAFCWEPTKRTRLEGSDHSAPWYGGTTILQAFALNRPTLPGSVDRPSRGSEIPVLKLYPMCPTSKAVTSDVKIW